MQYRWTNSDKPLPNSFRTILGDITLPSFIKDKFEVETEEKPGLPDSISGRLEHQIFERPTLITHQPSYHKLPDLVSTRFQPFHYSKHSRSRQEQEPWSDPLLQVLSEKLSSVEMTPCSFHDTKPKKKSIFFHQSCKQHKYQRDIFIV